MFQALGKLLEIDYCLSTAFYPQTDGYIEQANQTLEGFLRIFCGHNPGMWINKLADAEIIHNTRMHKRTRKSPYQILYGYSPQLILLAFPPLASPTADQIAKQQSALQSEALAAHEITRQRMFKRGTKVWPSWKVSNKV